MKLLLDTNALIWQLAEHEEQSKLGKQTRKMLEEADVVYVSAISIVECHVKTLIGKLDTPHNMMEVILEAGDEILEFTGYAADLVAEYPQLIRHDPFDRMILAQAKAENLALLTADTTLLSLGFPFVFNARL